jgi:hypothetical protein
MSAILGRQPADTRAGGFRVVNGLYDGFEGYRVSSPEEIAESIRTGLVAVDANALLNLYRYNAGTSKDLLRVLGALGDRLVVPNQVVREFWRNRIAAIGNPNAAAQQARDAMEKNRKSTSAALNQWAKQVALEDEVRDQLHTKINGLYDELTDAIAGGQPNTVQSLSAHDPILEQLEVLLSGKVSSPLEPAEWDKCVQEGRRRVDALEPPGYLDSDKVDSEIPEGPTGDYLVWYQACRATEERNLDLLVVTGDEKEDWWWRHRGDFLGPRPELVTELLRETGHRLFMLRPKDLLALSSVLAVAVSEESVADAERARPSYSSKPEWTAPAVVELLSRLDEEGRAQSEVIRVAAQMGGEVDRDTVYAICEFDDDRMLRGFTRPTARITADLRASGLVEDGVTAMLIPRYEGVKAAAFRIPTEVVKILHADENGEHPS